MHLIYIDDSKDEKKCLFSALAVPASQWQNIFQQVKDFRKTIRNSDGIYIHKELHACEFVGDVERYLMK